MKERKKKSIFLLQIIIAVILLIGILLRIKYPVIIDTDISKLFSNYMTYTKAGWKTNEEILNLNNEEALLYGPYLKLKPGSYTVYLEYGTNKTQTCELYSREKQAFLHANKFFLSHNKQKEKYDFYVTSTINDFEIRIIDYNGGKLTLSAIKIYKNSHNLRILLFIWIILSIIVDLILFNNWIRKNHILIMEIVSVSTLASIVLFMNGIGWGHDSGFHFQRIESIAEGIKTVALPVKMYSTYNDGYGYPVGIYYGDLLLYIPAILRVCGFGVVSAYKIFVYLLNLFTAIIGYWSFERIFQNKKTALLTTLVYVTSSYRFLDLYVRMAVGEYIALTFLPLIASAAWNIYNLEVTDKNYKDNSIILALGMVGLVYSHILSTEMVTLSLCILALVYYKKTFRKETICVYVKAIVMFLTLGAAFIVPFLDYFLHEQILLTQSNSDNMLIQNLGAYISDYFAVFRDFYGVASFSVNERMQLTPGFMLMLGLIVAVAFVVLKKATKEIQIMTIISIILLLIASNVFPWNQLEDHTKIGKIITQVQFPWRFIGLALVTLSILLGFLIECIIEKEYFEKNILYSVIVVGCVIMSCIFISSYENNVAQVHYLDTAELPEYTYSGNNRPLAAPEYLLPNTNIESLDYTIKGQNAEGKIISEKGIDMLIYVDAEEGSYIEIPRFFYSNYQVENEEGEKYAIEKGDNNKIRILFSDKIEGNIYVKYVEPWYWRMSEGLSLIGIALVLFYRKRMYL